MYPEEIVKPMKEELTNIGFNELLTRDDVNIALEKTGTTLIVVNSICGCAAANARPGVHLSLQNNKKPDNLVTVFAGVDTEATNSAREMMIPFPPSSPSIALFKNGTLVHMIERHHIEGRPAEIKLLNVNCQTLQFLDNIHELAIQFGFVPWYIGV